MNQIKLAIVTIGCIFLAACGSSESGAKASVLAALKDPDSAKFGKFTQVNEKGACLGVNARNSMGGYTGEQQASLMKFPDSKEWQVLTIDQMSHEACVEQMKELAKPK